MCKLGVEQKWFYYQYYNKKDPLGYHNCWIFIKLNQSNIERNGDGNSHWSVVISVMKYLIDLLKNSFDTFTWTVE